MKVLDPAPKACRFSFSSRIAIPLGVGITLGFALGGALSRGTQSLAEQRKSPPLLFLHGFTCDPTYWDLQTKFFSPSFRTFIPILPVHPGSEIQAEATVKGLAEAMLNYIDDQIGEPPVVIGHSLGGMVGLQMALTSPEKVRAVVLADAFPSLEVTRKASFGLFGPATPDALRRKIQMEMRTTREKMCSEERERLWNSIDAMDVTTRLREVAIPVHGIYGGRDQFKPGEEGRLMKAIALDRIPEASVSILAGVGHFVQMEHPTEFNRILERFIEGLGR